MTIREALALYKSMQKGSRKRAELGRRISNFLATRGLTVTWEDRLPGPRMKN